MDRRELLKLGALASVSGSSCAALLSNPGQVTAGDMDGFLAALDGALENLSSANLFEKLLQGKPQSPELSERAKKGEALTKKTMRSLLLVGTLQELPPEHMQHEGVQQRLRDSMGEFDDAMFGMTDVLEGMSSTERADVSAALRENPDLGMTIMGAVDEEAAAFGVSLKQRTRLRTISSHVCGRLRQSPELTMTEYTGKMRKLGARHGALSQAQREAAAAIGTSMIWQSEGVAGGAVGGSAPEAGSQLTPPPPPPMVEPMAEGQGQAQPQPPAQNPSGYQYQPKKKSTPSTGLLTAGGIALGVGATVFGLGFLGGSGWLLLGITFGVLLGLAGLICLIIGLIFLASGK